ncbi:MAG TPA: apolipoprotein N-acyltransferase, partial [Candidatus Nitrosotenuis sp.]|nr:apolipoprotein N-acyltransferase [Candidatus Nitrosotenuis sp.]
LSSIGFIRFNLWLLPSLLSYSAYLYFLNQCKTNRQAWWSGYSFGLGHFTIGLYWLGEAFRTVDLTYLVPIGWFGLPLLFSFYSALASYGTYRLTQTPMGRALCFSGLWALSEWCRGHLFTGFPWNLSGYIWPLEILQTTSVIGIYGLSALTLLLATSFYARLKSVIAAIIMLFVGFYLWGQVRLTYNPTQEWDVNLRIVQASIPQNQKWLEEKFEDNLNRYIALSNLEAERPLQAVIWSEAAVPAFVEKFPNLLAKISTAVPPQGLLILGAPRALRAPEGGENWYTGLIAINSHGNVVDSYEKSHLVPFGEYMPFRWLHNISKLTFGTKDYSPGHGIETLNLPGLPSVSPLICYEAIFPGSVALRNDRPQWLLNQTNDAWYGDTAGPRQHLKIVSVRAIEEGIPLVRVANNGISAVIDALGRTLYRLELNDVGFIDFKLPKPLEQPTLYSQLSYELFFWAVVTMCLLASLWVERRIIRKNAVKFI